MIFSVPSFIDSLFEFFQLLYSLLELKCVMTFLLTMISTSSRSDVCEDGCVLLGRMLA